MFCKSIQFFKNLIKSLVLFIYSMVYVDYYHMNCVRSECTREIDFDLPRFCLLDYLFALKMFQIAHKDDC